MYKPLLYIQVTPQYSQAITVSRGILSLAEPHLETVGEQSVKLIQSLQKKCKQ